MEEEGFQDFGEEEPEKSEKESESDAFIPEEIETGVISESSVVGEWCGGEVTAMASGKTIHIVLPKNLERYLGVVNRDILLIKICRTGRKRQKRFKTANNLKVKKTNERGEGDVGIVGTTDGNQQSGGTEAEIGERDGSGEGADEGTFRGEEVDSERI